MHKVSDMLYAQGFDMTWTPAAVQFLTDNGYDPEYGARPVKRAIQHLVLDDMSKALIAGTISKDKPVTVDANTSGLFFK